MAFQTCNTTLQVKYEGGGSNENVQFLEAYDMPGQHKNSDTGNRDS